MFVIQTRFSIYNKNIDSTAWQLGRGENKNILQLLMDEDRLRLRCDIFFKYSLPSIDKAHLSGYEILHVVPYYKNLPQWVVDKFNAAKEKYTWFKPLPFDYEDDLSLFDIIKDVLRRHCIDKGLEHEFSYAGIRLDDDDLIGMKYFDRLKQYMLPEFNGFCISLAKGIAAEWKDGAYVRMASFYEAKNAQGLAQINRYDAKTQKFLRPHLLPPGSHPTVDLRVPTVLDSRGDPVFVRTFHGNNDIFVNLNEANNQRYLDRIFKEKVEFSVNEDL